jgi:asparagine synthase (glutamine-hydrolysing)
MCGIGLIINLNTNKNTISKHLDTIHKTQKHRGPDFKSKKIYNLGNNIFLGLCHQRLSIIDLSSKSNQPIEFCNGRYVLIYNGEIYNYKELKKSLKNIKNKKKFGDTLTLTKFWEKFKENCFAKFRGMWAIIIYDKKKREVTLCRDRFGIKPLYIYKDNNQIICTSEIRAILNIIKSDELNIEAVNNYLYLGITNYSTETFFKNISSLKTGIVCKIKITSKDLIFFEDKKIFNKKYKKKINNFNEAVSKYGEKITHSVKNHFESDVEVGLLLSGGLDSNGILYTAKKLNKKLKTFSIFSNSKYSEEKLIKLSTKNTGNKNFFYRMNDDNDFKINKIIKVSYINEYPLLSTSALAHYKLMKLANKKKIKVLLTGQGADEILLGYRKFIFFFLKDLLIKKKILSFFKYFLYFLKNSEIFSSFNFSDAKKYIKCINLNTNKSLFSHKITKLENISFYKNLQSRILKDQKQYSIPALLNYEDKISMSCGIEMRVPYLDEDLVDFLNSLNNNYKFHKGVIKSISKKFFENTLPNEIIKNKKRIGFTLPQNNMYANKNKIEIFKKFNNSIAFKKKLIDKKNFINSLRGMTPYSKENKEMDRTIFFLSWSKAFEKNII